MKKIKEYVSRLCDNVKNYLKRYPQKVEALVVLVLLYVALILSIVYRVDGLGVFSVAGCFLVFCFLIFYQPKVNGVTGSGGGDVGIQSNKNAIRDAISNPAIINPLIVFILKMIPFISNNLHLLGEHHLEELKAELSILDEKIRAQEKPTRHQP